MLANYALGTDSVICGMRQKLVDKMAGSVKNAKECTCAKNKNKLK